MDAVPGVLARNMGSMSGTNRARDYSGGISLNGSTNDRAAQSSNPWGSNIWNTAPASTSTTNTTSRFGFGSTTRESSRPREGSYDATEGKTGSGSLVADSETEWRPSRPLWADTGAAGIPHARSSGVSPARQRSLVQPSSQQYTESSSFFPISRNAAVGSGSSSKTTKPVLDPTSSNFTSTNFASPRQIDSLSNGFASFGFGYQETPQQRPDTAVTSWPDSASVHSPSDERRSVAAPEYFTSSGATSRNGSLPPSRHGAEVAQYSQHIDALSRFAQAAPRQTSSFSYTNGRSFQERSGSMQSETFHTSNRFAVEHEQEASSSHRPSISINGMAPNYSHSSQDSHVARDSYPDAQIAPRTDNTSYRNGTYTPDSYSNGQVSEPSAQFRNFQFDSRSAPNGSGVRQSPFYSHNHSHTHTPPVYDRLNPYSSEQTLSHPNNFALVQNKLAGYQIQQERRNYIPNNQFHQQQYQHILPATQLRHPYAYSFAIPNGMPMSALPPHMAMASMSPMMSTQQPPRGPREQQISDGPGIMSAKLVDFKREQKTSSKRWELPDIYDNVVEFAGDQHGSRFIQLKLETANSEVKEKIFKELESNSLQLMQDVFGNYVIQKFFEHGDQTQKKILAGRMKGHVLALTNQMYACRVVQKALEYVLVDQQVEMVRELEKNPLLAVQDQNGNHVIQKVIERVPLEYMHGIVEAFRGSVGKMSVNPYGCRVIQRLLEKVPEPQRRFFFEELHAEGDKLITDSYGNYVTQHVIEHGLPEDRSKVVDLIKAKYLLFSKHKFASNVVERCLVCGSDDQRRELVEAFIAKNDRGENELLNLLRDGYGNYVIQKLLETLSQEDYNTFVAALKPELEKCKKIVTGGKQIISVEKKMFRYDRVDSPTAARELIEAPPTPATSSSAQSPQSTSMPSTTTSSVDDSVHTSTLIVTKDGTTPPVLIQEPTS